MLFVDYCHYSEATECTDRWDHLWKRGRRNGTRCRLPRGRVVQYSQRHTMINHCDRHITLLSDTDIYLLFCLIYLLILSLKRRIKHSAWLYMLRFIATFLTNWHITPWQHNTSINRNKLWNSYLVCAIRHCSPACLVHNFRCQWYTVIMIIYRT